MKKLAFIAIISILIFAGCKKNLEVMEPTPSPTQVTKMADMNVNADFAWNTEKNIQVDVKSNVKGVLYIKSKDGTVYHKAMMNYGDTYQTSIAVPTCETELEVLLANQSKTIPATSDWISVFFQ